MKLVKENYRVCYNDKPFGENEMSIANLSLEEAIELKDRMNNTKSFVAQFGKVHVEREHTYREIIKDGF